MHDHIRILRKAYASMISAMQLLERQGEEVPQKAIDTLAMLETVRDKKSGGPIISESEKVTVSLVKQAEDPTGEAAGLEISERGVLPSAVDPKNWTVW